MKTISFCITCMNRLAHLKATLEKNILDNYLIDAVEFVLLDYNSKDGLEDWVYINMKKYIDNSILVYYKTLEPVIYLRSHSRNMVFRLAGGSVVCNLDADNFLGKGFAEYMIKMFNNNENIFFISNLRKRDVFGRVCLTKKDFDEVRGYNEALVGYGLEDAEIYNRLLLKGLKQCIFLQKEFYGAVTHPDEERISQEAMFKNLQCVYLNYLNPFFTEVLVLYADKRCGLGIVENNYRMNYNLSSGLSGVELCMDKRFRITIKDKWEEARWAETNQNIILKSKKRELMFCKNAKGLFYHSQQYYQITDNRLIVEIIMVITEALNFLNANKIADDVEMVNFNGFGKGILYKNFDYNNQLTL